jgi:GSCFA family
MTQQNPVSRPRDLTSWNDFFQDPDFYVAAKALLRPDTKIFTMGSCFAFEVRRALHKRGFRIYPDYISVPFNPAVQVYDKVLERNTLFHYDTFVLRQEFEEIFGLWTDRAANFCEVRGQPANQILGADVVYQDPTRRLVYGKTLPLLTALSNGISQVTREGLAQSDVIVLTLGLTEVWPHIKTGRYFCLPPGAGLGGGEGLATFQRSVFSENIKNMRAILDLITTHYPKKHVVISVSPVHLEKTYSGLDVGTASTKSKSILRAVAGQIVREYKNVTYYPAYEMAQFWRTPVFNNDGRHVLSTFADKVVAGFIAVFSDSQT